MTDFNIKYTYDIYQYTTEGYYEGIFFDLHAESFSRWCRMGRSPQPGLAWTPVSANRYSANFYIAEYQPYMDPNALKYVLCTINRTRPGNKIFLELPADFIFAVKVYQVLLILQVDLVIDPLYGHIRQTIRDTTITAEEMGVMWDCLRDLDLKLYFFAVNRNEERNYSSSARGGASESERQSAMQSNEEQTSASDSGERGRGEVVQSNEEADKDPPSQDQEDDSDEQEQAASPSYDGDEEDVSSSASEPLISFNSRSSSSSRTRRWSAAY